jgi:tetratricopeptide (TPR) repeat protein
MPSITFRTTCLGLGLGLILTGCASHPRQAARDLMAEGRAYRQHGRLRSAAIEYQRALQLEPRSAAAYRGLAQVELAERHWPQAYAALRESLNLSPRQPDVDLDLARLYLQSREFTHAASAARQALALRPSDPAAHQVLAAVDAALHHPRRARRRFAQITVLAPRDPNAWVNLALADAGLHHPRRAQADLRQAIAIAPHLPLAYADLANLDFARHRPARARQALQRGLAANPDSVALWLQQARLDAGSPAWRQDLQTLLARRPQSARAALAASRAFAAAGDLAAAQSVAAAAVRRRPDSEPLEQQAFDCDLATGALPAAEALDLAWLHRAPSSLGARLAKDRLLLARNQAAVALPGLRTLARQNAGSAPARYYLGLAEWQTGSRSQAVQDVTAALRRQPDSLAMLKALATMQLAQGSPRDAARYAARYARLDPGASAWKLQGRAALAQARDADALADFTSAHLAASARASDHALLAEAAAGAGRAALARSEFARALALAPASSRIAGSALHDAVQRRDWATAAAIVAKFEAAAPRDPHGPWLAATLAMAQRQWPQAASALHAALRLQPGFVEADLDLGRIRQQTGPWRRALYWYQQAARREPGFAPLLTLIGNLYLQQRQWASAASYYQRALASQPDFALAAANLAWIKAEQNQDLANALILAQRADHEMPNVPSVGDTLAWVYYKLGSYGSALPLLRRCVQASPAQPTYRFHLGMALLASGDKRSGAAELRRALALRLSAADAKTAERALAGARS